MSKRELCTELVDTTKEGSNNLAVSIKEQELRTEVDTTKKGANNLAVAISEQELHTEVDTTKEGANNQIMEW